MVDLKRLLDAYRRMYLIRRAEEWVVEQYAEQNAVFAAKKVPEHCIKCPTHLSIGQEAVPVGVCSVLTTQDVMYSTHRCHAHYLAKGGDLTRMMAELLGRSTGCAKGKGGSMHLVDPTVGMYGSSAIVGGSIPLAVGAALAFRMRKEPHVAVVFFGDGATEEGIFYESLHFAALRRLPVIFVCENNLYATLSHIEARRHVPIAQYVKAAGITYHTVNGNDVTNVSDAANFAVSWSRNGGPSFIEASTYRWYAHVGTEPDTGKGRRTQEELAAWKQDCPLRRLRVMIEARGSADDLDEIERSVNSEVAEALERAKAGPEPSANELMEGV